MTGAGVGGALPLETAREKLQRRSVNGSEEDDEEGKGV